MLIHEQDFLMIDLEKSSSEYLRTGDENETITSVGAKLIFTVQINGKLRRTIIELEVLPLDSFKKLHHLENAMSSEDKAYMINEYHSIYTALDMLHDFGYKLKNDEYDFEYMGLIDQISEGVQDLFKTN